MNSDIKKIKENNKARPFLKWAGGKRRLLKEIQSLMPCKYNRYFEPFLGGGALFFELQPKDAYLSDVNPELINAYIQVRDNIEEVVFKLKQIRFTKKNYYNIRAQRPNSSLDRAIRFVYLNRTCWNGLYRENASGEFNVPIGCYDNPMICDEDNLRAASRALKNVKILAHDFEKILKKVKKNDFIYLDPPYVTGHKNNGFIEYNSKIFKWDEQKSLQKLLCKLDKKRCKFILSNAAHKTIKRLYSGFNITSIERVCAIAADRKYRKITTEFLITNFA